MNISLMPLRASRILSLSAYCVLIVLVGCSTTSGQVSQSPTAKVDAVIPPTNWVDQLSLAQESAKKVSSDALLLSVIAQTPARNGKKPLGDFKNLEFAFTFYNPSEKTDASDQEVFGQRMQVSFEDTAPLSTLTVNPAYDFISPIPSQKEQEELRAALATVKIGPRDVLQITKQEESVQSLQSEASTEPLMQLKLESKDHAYLHSQAFWFIRYLVPSNKDPYFVIDAESGKILEQGINRP